MSSGDRVVVPLKSMCSRKCVDPAVRSVSCREPEPTHTPTVSDWRPGTVSVMMRMPPGRTVRSMRPPSPAERISLTMACSGLLGRRVRLVRALGLVDDGDERQLAAVVDLRDLDLDLLAHAQNVLDVLDALGVV